MTVISADDRKWMRQAIELGRRSVPEEGKIGRTPMVGAVIVAGDGQVYEGYRGRTGVGDHAEFGILKELGFPDLGGATIYTTLEPCAIRKPDKVPCSTRLVDANVARVWMGVYDPHPSVGRKGWRRLLDAKIPVLDFPPELREEISHDNAEFMTYLRVGYGDAGTAEFDYTQNGGQFLIQNTSSGAFVTRWTPRGGTSIYAVDDRWLIGDARYARDFADIDDPTAFEWTSHSRPVEAGGVVLFRNGSGGHCLVKVIRVQSEDYGDDRNVLEIEWLIRAKSAAP